VRAVIASGALRPRRSGTTTRPGGGVSADVLPGALGVPPDVLLAVLLGPLPVLLELLPVLLELLAVLLGLLPALPGVLPGAGTGTWGVTVSTSKGALPPQPVTNW